MTREENQIKGEQQWNDGKPTASRFLINSGIPQSSIFGPVLFGVDSIIVTGLQKNLPPICRHYGNFHLKSLKQI